MNSSVIKPAQPNSIASLTI